MRCRGMQGIADTAYLEGFLFSVLPSVAPYCVPGGVRVVSTSSLYPRGKVVHTKLLSVLIGQALPHAIDR
jgi:hypothetical protein